MLAEAGSIAAIVAGAAAVGSIMWRLMVIVIRNRRLGNSFALSFPTVDYPVPPDAESSATKEIEVGNTKVLVQVKVNFAQTINRVNLRFAQTGRGDDVAPEIISISNVYDDSLRSLQIRDSLTGYREIYSADDGAGGVHGTYSPPRFIGKGVLIFFTITVNARAPWEGYLSFRAFDVERNRRHSRLPFKVEAQPHPTRP